MSVTSVANTVDLRGFGYARSSLRSTTEIQSALDKLFDLSRTRSFTPFFWFYNAGLIVTVAMMFVHGTMDVLGKDVSGAVPGIAGLGHILLTIGLVCFFVSLRSRALGDKKGDKPASEPVNA